MKKWEKFCNNDIISMTKATAEMPFSDGYKEKHLDKRAKEIYNDWKKMAETGDCIKIECLRCRLPSAIQAAGCKSQDIIEELNKEVEG